MASMRDGDGAKGAGANPDDVATGEHVVPRRSPMEFSRMDIPAIPGFTIRRLLGRGGMGAVYEAEQHRPRRTVALKIIRPGTDSSSMLRRFETEIQALASLEHPNVARIYDAGAHVEGGAARPYYAMEFIDGALPIDEYAAKHNLSLRRRVELFLKVCDAVYAGHCRGIVHRDLKPENVLVDLSGQPKVIDFGVARLVGDAASHAASGARTAAGQIVGTVRYMSPEQVEARPEAIDERSDVYALGVILYELLTGELPYDLANRTLPEIARAIARAIRESPPKHPSAIRHTVTGDLETVVLKAIEKARSGRYQTAQALCDDLSSWLRGEPIEARRMTVPYILTRRFRQIVHRAPVVSMVVAAALVWALLHLLGGPIIYEWAPRINYSYRSALAAVSPNVGAARSLDRVRVIAIDDASKSLLAELAAEHGIEGVVAGDLGSARALGGALMKRLAEAHASAVAWDLGFRLASDDDAAFVEGVNALKQNRARVVVGVWGWGSGQLSEHIRPHVLYAFPSVYTGQESAVQRVLPSVLRGREGWAHIALAVDRGQPVALPGFALLAVAAHRQPHLDVAVRLDWDRDEAQLHYFEPRQEPGLPQDWRVKDHMRFTGYAEPEANERYNLFLSDKTAVYAVQMPAHEALDHATHAYEWALRAPIGELRSAFRGRVVVIGMTDGTDQHDLGLDRQFHGVHVQAAAVEAILRDEFVRYESKGFTAWMIAIGCAAGLLGGAWLSGPRRRAVALLIVAFALLLALSVWLYSFHRFVYNPLLPVAAIVLTAMIAYGLQRTRRDFVI